MPNIFQWLQDTFLVWLDIWEEEISKSELNAETKKRYLLSTATLQGWRITCVYALSLIIH